MIPCTTKIQKNQTKQPEKKKKIFTNNDGSRYEERRSVLLHLVVAITDHYLVHSSYWAPWNSRLEWRSERLPRAVSRWFGVGVSSSIFTVQSWYTFPHHFLFCFLSLSCASSIVRSYHVGSSGRMAFGAPTRALFIPQEDAERWDAAIHEASEVYRGRMHNICCDNCHSHVANALNRMPTRAYGIESWDMVKLALLVFVKGRFLSAGGIYMQFGPFAVMVLLVLLFKMRGN